MHASIPTTYLSGFSMYSFSFFVFLFFYFYLTSLSFLPSFIVHSYSLYTIYHGGICQFYPLTAFGSL